MALHKSLSMAGHGHSSFLEWESLLWRLTAMPAALIPAWGEEGGGQSRPCSGALQGGAISLAQCWQLSKHLVAVHFWELQGMISTGGDLWTPASAVWDPIATTSKWHRLGQCCTSCHRAHVCSQPAVPAQARDHQCHQGQEKTARNTQNPASPPVPFIKGTSFAGLEQSLLSLMCSGPCVAFCRSSLTVEDKGGGFVVYQ